MRAEELARLADPFPQEDIEWKPGAVTRDKSKALAMAYITNRAIQDRLDAACGPGDWRNEYTTGPDGGVLCGISVRIEREDKDGNPSAEWITKWDGAENTAVESIKGGLSGAMKRAAVQWGIGRYLYRIPQQWVPLDERGRFRQEPRIPAEFLPAAAAPSSSPQPAGGDGASSPAPAPARTRRAARGARPQASPQPPQERAAPAAGTQAPDAKTLHVKTPDVKTPPPARSERRESDAADFFPGDLPF